MVSYMDRLIGSAQRRVVIPNPNVRSLNPCQELVFQIQGLDLRMKNESIRFEYANMAEAGIFQKKSKKLRILERLLRKPALIGELFEDEKHVLNVSFWTEPELTLYFDLNPEGHVELWSEAYIMLRSAGFDLKRVVP